MPTGSCLCGNIRIEYTGNPAKKLRCHCADCRKISGGNYSNNIIIRGSDFKLVSGTPKTFTKVSDSGNSMTSHFCPGCGVTVFRCGTAFGDLKFVKSGVLDDVGVIREMKPEAEYFVARRVPWVAPVEGAEQIQGML